MAEALEPQEPTGGPADMDTGTADMDTGEVLRISEQLKEESRSLIAEIDRALSRQHRAPEGTPGSEPSVDLRGSGTAPAAEGAPSHDLTDAS